MEAPQHEVGMVFGVFDGFHQGHQHFLTQSAAYCQKLVVVVARPEIVLALKKRFPRHTLEERIDHIRTHNPTWEVIPGDEKIGTWSALKKYQPGIVLLGHDQETLGQELDKLHILHTVITAFHPDKYKSSLLHKSPQ